MHCRSLTRLHCSFQSADFSSQSCLRMALFIEVSVAG